MVPRLAVHVVHQQILAQRVGRGEIRLAAADLGHLLHEIHQAVIAGQHEGIDQDPLLLAAVHFFQRAADHQRVEAEGVLVHAAVFQRQAARLAVGDHDDLPHVLALLAEQPLRQNQAVARVGVVRAHLHARQLADAPVPRRYRGTARSAGCRRDTACGSGAPAPAPLSWPA